MMMAGKVVQSEFSIEKNKNFHSFDTIHDEYNKDVNFSHHFLLFSSVAQSSSTIQIYQKSQTSPPHDSNGSKSAKSSTTPTSDVLRIYVPPADDMIPEKNIVLRERGDDEISQCSNRSSIVHVEYETVPFEKPLHKSPTKHDEPLPGANKFQPQQYYYYPNPNPTQYQSSSSRRGSMTRKTPSPMLNDLIVECDHMKIRRSQEFENEDISLSYSVNENIPADANKFYQFNSNSSNNNSSLKRLTSFEEIAKNSENNSLLYIHETTAEINPRQYPSNGKPKSDYNICYNYKNLDDREDLDYASVKQQQMKKSTSHSYNIRRSERKHSSSDNSPFDYDLLKEKRKEKRFMYGDDASNGKPLENNENSIKSYDRFFNSDDELEDDEIRSNRASKKSNSSGTHKYLHISGTEADDDDENSSNSPTNNKSILNTPINDTMPLLSSDVDSTFYQSPAPPSTLSSSRQKSKIPRPRGSSNNSSLRKSPSVSSPDSEGYQTSINRYDVEQTVVYQSVERKGSTQRSDNKIRIKINQKN